MHTVIINKPRTKSPLLKEKEKEKEEKEEKEEKNLEIDFIIMKGLTKV